MRYKPIVCCVLKTGGIYTPEYVIALANSVKRNTTKPIEFAVLSDSVESFNHNVDHVVPLNHYLPGWWSKIELFRHDFFPNHKKIFFDLDTVILGNVDFLIEYDVVFSGLEDFYQPERFASGIMTWNGDLSILYEDFIAAYGGNHNILYEYDLLGGDQYWIESKISKKFQLLQHAFPQKIVSLKKHCVVSHKTISVPDRASILCFHGKPKPHELTRYDIIKENWG